MEPEKVNQILERIKRVQEMNDKITWGAPIGYSTTKTTSTGGAGIWSGAPVETYIPAKPKDPPTGIEVEGETYTIKATQITYDDLGTSVVSTDGELEGKLVRYTAVRGAVTVYVSRGDKPNTIIYHDGDEIILSKRLN